VNGNSSPLDILFAGAAAQQIEIASNVALIQLRVPGSTWLVVISSRSSVRGVGVVGREAKARARELLGPERVRFPAAGLLGIEATGAWLLRGDRISRLGYVETRLSPLRDEPRDAVDVALAPAIDLDEWLRRGEELLDKLASSSLDSARRALVSKVTQEQRRLTRRVTAVASDLERARLAEGDAEAAKAFVADAARAPRGTVSLSAVDWASGEPITRTLALDPAKRPKDQVEAIFTRGRRLKRGAVVAQSRIDDARQKLTRLHVLLDAAASATTLDDLSRASAVAHAEDPALLSGLAPGMSSRPTSATRSRPSPARTAAARVPFRAFLTSTGARILVGRGAADNDALTLHFARPHDLWLHAKGESGAHVVVPLAKGHDAPAALLVDAAHLAAHFSDARGEAVVDVTYTPKKHVRKPRGSKPGQVLVDREKVIVVRIDAGRLTTLLAREENAT
jgi:predicted ribosome quality control (RQC) complex YloA/Tae2 family protein